MKKGLFLSMALILTMFLTFILFSGNKAEAFYGGLGTYSGLYGGLGVYGGLYGGLGAYGGLYGGIFSPVSTPGGYIYTPSPVSSELGAYGGLYGGLGAYGGLYGGIFSPVGTPGGYIYTPSPVSSELGYYESAPSPMIQYHLESEILPLESSFTQTTQWLGPLNNFPSFMPSFGAVPVTYSVYPIVPEWPRPDFPAIYSSTLISPSPALLSNPYWPNVYPTVSYPTPLGSIQITK